MTTSQLRDYLVKQAAVLLDELGGDAQSGTEAEVLERIQANVRRLSGTARLAGEDRLHRAAAAILRALQDAAKGSVPEDLGERLTRSVDEMRSLLDAIDPAAELDALAAGIVARWSEADALNPADLDTPDTGTFALFVEREVEAIAETMDKGLSVFTENPGSREWLGAILRRQRALLGSVRLEDVTIVAETLKAVEEVSELIVRLDVPVKSEWLDVFRCARDVLRSAAESLRQNEEPTPTPSLSRLRTLREELVDRYGDRQPARPSEEEPELGAPAAISGQTEDDPRQRAAVLKVQIANALAEEPEARRALDDLYTMLLSALR